MVPRRWQPPGQARAADLAALLEPYADPNSGQAGRLLDVPPGVAVAALQLLPEDLRVARLNGTQPPMRDLAAVAVEFGGRLIGGLMSGRAFVRFDGVQVPAAAAGGSPRGSPPSGPRPRSGLGRWSRRWPRPGRRGRPRGRRGKASGPTC